MSYYVLTDTTARKLKTVLNSNDVKRTSVQRYGALASPHDKYPDPYTIQWTESLISGGGFMIWLPPNALNVAGTDVPLSGAYSEMTYQAVKPIQADLTENHWYELGIDKNSVFPDSDASISGFSVWLSWMYGNQFFRITNLSATSLSATSHDVEVELQSGVTDIKIADVKNYAAIQNINDTIIINNNFKPFDFLRLPTLNGESDHPMHAITRCDFMCDGNPIHLSSCYTPGASHDSKQVIRLVQSLSGNTTSCFALDMTDYGNRYARTMQRPLGILDSYSYQPTVHDFGEVIPPGDEIAQFWPLYMLNRKESILVDYRDAYYILQPKFECDENSIMMSTDVDLSSEWRDKLHIAGFHTQGDSTAFDSGTSFIVRQGGNGIATPPSGDEEVDYINLVSFRDGIMQQVADTMSSAATSAVGVDEKSVSKGGDGWQLSSESGVQPVLHMWNFHSQAADLSDWSGDLFFALRNGIGDQASLAYTNLEVVASKLSTMIEPGGGGGGEISADQLSALPSPGMFAWTPKTQTMGVGGVMVGRQWVTATGTGSGKADGLYQVQVTIGNDGSYGATVVSNATLGQAPTTTQCWIPIYQISDSKISADYRGAFVVPAFD